MAFYKSKYTGTEIDQRLTQATYDDAVLAGFKGSKEEFDAILGKLKEIANKAENSIQMESENLETFNKNVIDAINELYRGLQAKPDKADLDTKVDWVDYNNTKNIVLPSNGQVFGDFGGEESNSSLLGARIYNAGLENEEKQVEVGTSKVHLNLNSLDKPTIETPDGKENLVVESDIELIPIEVNFPIRTSGGSDGPEDRIYTQEEILDWFGVTDIAALKTQMANKGIQYIKYGIVLMGNPYYYKMPVQYAAFESANQIKLVFTGLNTRNDAPSKYEMIMNLDGTIIEGNSNVKMTISNLSYDDTQLRNELQQTETGVATANSEIEKLQSGKQSIQDETLQTTDKTVVGSINELLTKVKELESRLAALEGTN